MDVESLAKQLILQNMTPEQQSAVLESVRATLQEARGKQKQRVSENVGMVVDALKKIEADIRAKYDDLGNKITARVNSIRDGRDGANGSDGRDGLDGRPGRDGAQGPAGPAGRDGSNGIDGVDGVSVIDAKIDFDGSLIISLSNGREINVGEVVAPDLAEKIKVITNGGGTSQTVLDALASLQQQIDNLIPSQSGNTGKFLTTDGSTLSWASVTGSGLTYQGTWNASTNTPTLASGTGTSGYYYVVSVAGTTTLDGVSDWQPGDWVVFNGTAWQKIDQSWAIAGANDNITSMTGITGGISSPDFVQFDTAPTTTPTTAGALYWNSADGAKTLDLVMQGGNVVQQIGEETYFRIKASSAVTNGQAIMFTGTVGASGALQGAPATGLTADTAAYFMGVATEDIALNDWGYVTHFGLVRGIDTSGGAESWVDGEILYYDPTVTGGLTKTVPTAPAAKIQVAAVVYASAVNGSLFVRPIIRTKLENLNDVETAAASTNDILQYTASGYWTHTPPANLTGVGSLANALTIGSGLSGTSYDGSSAVTITNTAPDQTVSLTGAGTTSISGTYPNFTITSNDQYTGTVTSVGGTGTVNGISLSGTVTSSGNLTLGGTLSGVDLTTQVTGTLPIANGGTGASTANDAFNALAPSQTGNSGKYLTTNGTDTSWVAISSTGTVTSVAATVPSFLSVSGSPITTSGTLAISYSGTALPVANGGTGITSFGSGVATWLGTPSSANLAAAVTDETGSGALVFGTSPTLTTPKINSAQVATVSGTAPLYMCRAWVNFNGTGTVAIRASGNVSSITDNGTGQYTVNFTNAMPDANYSAIVTGGPNNSSVGGIFGEAACYNTISTSAVRIAFITHTGSIVDDPYCFVSIFR